MKKAISFLLCIVMLCSIFTVTTSAAANYCDVFHSEVFALWWTVAFSGSDQVTEFSPYSIKFYTLRKINLDDYYAGEKEIDYGYGTYYVRSYSIPADVFEGEALKHFNISDMDAFRNDTGEPTYNADTNTYDMLELGGWGDSVTYTTKGYKNLGNGKYEVYGYTVQMDYEKPDDAVEGVDYIMHNGYPAEIVKCLKVTIEYNGTDVKFLSWETISLNDVPDIKALVHNHVSSDWIIDKVASVTAAGKKHKECTDCRAVLETATIAQLKCSKPTLSSISNTTSGVKVSWGKVSGADRYSVYRKTSSSGWTCLNSKVTSTSYTDTTAKSGTTYYYTVRAENEAGHSSYNSAGISIKRLSTPKLSDKENTTSGVKITWGKVTGASGYIVYRKTSSGSWKELGKTTKTYYTDKTAKSGTTYYYTVRAYNGSVKSYYDTDGLKIKHLADPTLKTPTSTKSGITLKWNKITGAEGYMVYRKTGSGSYSRIATVKGSTKVTYTDKSAKKGKKYTYKVKAYYSKTYSAYSNTKTITDKY